MNVNSTATNAPVATGLKALLFGQPITLQREYALCSNALLWIKSTAAADNARIFPANCSSVCRIPIRRTKSIRNHLRKG